MISLRLLVPVDGSALAEAIIPHVVGLGCSSVLLVEVVEPPSLLFGDAPGAAAREAAARDALETLAARLRTAGCREVRTELRRGKAAEEIIAAAAAYTPGLISITTHGGSGYDPIILGHVAAKVIRTISFPILALNATEPPPAGSPPIATLGRVLLAHDGSDLASRGLDALALLAPRARVTLLGVVDTFEAPANPPKPGARDLAYEYTELRKEGLRRELERAAARARDLGFDADVDVDVEIDVGKPAARICDRAVAMPASCIAMTTHGRSGITRWALGSVTEEVLRASTVPLLITR